MGARIHTKTENWMATQNPTSRFKAELYRPEKPGEDRSWSFLLLPKKVSDTLPRRGRTTVEGAINDHPFQATLEPDGQLSHWLRVSGELQEATGVSAWRAMGR